jgi:tape measure domain-containing protein
MANEPALYARMELRIRDFERQLQKANAAADASMAKIGRSTQRTTRVVESRLTAVGKSAGAQFALLSRGGLAGVVGALGAREVLAYADSWTRTVNALKLAGLEGERLKQTQDDLYQAAQRQGVPFEALVTLYGRAAQASKELGASSAELTQFADDVAAALRVAQTSPEQASGALLQLSQLLGSARVQAEEFNSINEGARPILQAVANGIDEAGGSVSKLKQLVNDGAISNVAFFKGFQVGAVSLRQQAATTTDTIGSAFARVGNSITKMIGEVADTSGFSAGVVSDLKVLSDAVESLAGPIATLIGYLKTLRSWSDSVIDGAHGIGAALRQELKLDDVVTAKTLLADVTAEINGLRSAIAEHEKTNNAALVSDLAKRLAEAEQKRDALAQLVRETNRGSAISNPPFAPSGGIGSDRVVGGAMAEAATPIKASDYKPPAAEKDAKVQLDSYERLTAAIKERTGAIEAETAAQASLNPTLEDYGFAVEKARAEYDLLTAAQEAGLTITPELRAQIDTLSTAYANASAASAQLAESQGRVADAAAEFNALGRDVLGGFISDMQNGVSAADALSNALGKVGDKLLDIALNSIFSPQGGGAGGLAGLIGQALGLAGAAPVKLAAGGKVYGPGTATSDSVPAMLSRGEYVVNAKQAKKYAPLLEAINSGRGVGMAGGGLVMPTMRAPSLPAMAAVGRAGGGKGSTTVPISINIDARGADEAGLARVQQQLSQLRSEIPRMVVTSVANAKRRNVQGI